MVSVATPGVQKSPYPPQGFATVEVHHREVVSQQHVPVALE